MKNQIDIAMKNEREIMEKRMSGNKLVKSYWYLIFNNILLFNRIREKICSPNREDGEDNIWYFLISYLKNPINS